MVGEGCLGKISFVFRKQRGKPQKYRIRYHEGTVMECLEKDIERTPEPEEAREDRVSSSVEREEDEQLNVIIDLLLCYYRPAFMLL